MKARSLVSIQPSAVSRQLSAVSLFYSKAIVIVGWANDRIPDYMVIGYEFAHPTTPLFHYLVLHQDIEVVIVGWANRPDSRSCCQRVSICPPYAY
ncbi:MULTISPECIES: hypothetical protein [Moorena]|uniref:Uncharacterized protein n=1 Tax=Moorena producens 3L TaxID=489825 RepID=F4XWB2_9CYAN|nr:MULTISPECIES: hypothetical protein [Moorena]EGJ31097.1 hypothetical protein LYNGBM3L_43030 [Moorena producens 3L]NEP67960.1 hypothetical protein [Moorena sp. SIO3A5]